ncbi:hypothetical protein AAMO2058_001538200 [Amorphochlora amoebiformis]
MATMRDAALIESDSEDEDYVPDEVPSVNHGNAVGGKVAGAKRKRKKSRFGAAVISDDDDDDPNPTTRKQRTTYSEDEEEDSEDSEIDDLFNEMKRESVSSNKISKTQKQSGLSSTQASKPSSHSSNSTKEVHKSKNPSKPKKKKMVIPGLGSIGGSTSIIDFGDSDEEEEEKKEVIEVKEVKSFAGERIVVKKKVVKGSKEANKLKKRSNLDALLSSLKGKNKINTLDKCQIDWEKDKDKEGDREDLAIASRNGELDKQQFLLKTDHRQFEIEREIRNASRRKKGTIL